MSTILVPDAVDVVTATWSDMLAVVAMAREEEQEEEEEGADGQWSLRLYGDHAAMIAGPSVRFVKVVAGHAHWLALAENGALYSWGSNRFGQLGYGDTQDRDVPQIVEALHGIGVVEIACGAFHSAVISGK
ncbi:regulator of chromosome condensation 1/beta-lactamase-inhibitor protein II [Syncephalis pseudoplumigaleata]|uniref:Regulator of chromosome condensation 1/beta-lactamase-inhibitor protein II n=1 Tax=Syncephalis pseudoplumigaleata TaxID=1712513 RepID=A0A4P9Z4N1_9FUNG|nr:regulator of chromosome condensation 1/beta-lactamase-inhibitor protein II [Syncephalis pseudoplumigaleata]|eukprot:RKP27547.1 regulator of chromosome condensation 1/beta-lactamase-inhibitor protein II [Syncephalis pseudoplumigaleata]